jgi:hypothetical protein
MRSRLLGQRSVTVVEGGHTFRAVIGIGPSGLSIFRHPSDRHALQINQLNPIDNVR